MKTFLDFAPLILVFTVALVGLRKNTWNDDKKGLWNKLSITGRITAACAILGFAFGIKTTIDRRNEADLQRQVETRFRSWSMMRVQSALNMLATPFWHVRNEFKPGPQFPPEPSDEFDLDLGRFQDPAFVTKLSELHLWDTARSIGRDRTWFTDFALPTASFQTEVDQVLMAYARYIPPDVLLRLDRFQHHNYFHRVQLLGRRENVAEGPFPSSIREELFKRTDVKAFMMEWDSLAVALRANFDKTACGCPGPWLAVR